MTLGFQETLKYRWLIFGILALHFLLVYFHRVSTAVVAQDLVKAFHISGTALGYTFIKLFLCIRCNASS